jgi:hypothetical protein
MGRAGSTIVAAVFAAAIVAAAGSYARAQTMGEYGATLNNSGIAAENGSLDQPSELGQPSSGTGSALDRPSPFESGNDPLSEAPSYLGNSGNDSQGTAEDSLNQPSVDSSGIPYAPSVQ